MYIVFEVYYKHGEYSISEYPTKASLIAFLEEFVTDYGHKQDLQDLEADADNYLETLVKLSISVGSDVLEHQRGQGVVAVIKGREL
jgi:hypothetical protein